MLKKLTMLCLAVLPLVGCSSNVYDNFAGYEKKPAVLPFVFQVESFLDRRPNQGEPRLADVLNPRQSYPFKQDAFLGSLVHNINGRSFYEFEPATLRVELKDYAAFKEGADFTTSFYVDITGFDGDGRVLATGIFSCFAQEDVRLRAVSGLKNLFAHDQDPRNDQKRIADAWDDLYSECLNDIAYEFNAKVMQWQQRRS